MGNYLPDNVDFNRFAKPPKDRVREKNYINAEQKQRYERELKDLKRSLATPEQGNTGTEKGSHSVNKGRYSAAIKDRIREIEKILRDHVPDVVSGQEKDRLFKRMGEIEQKILQHRPLPMNKMKCNPRNFDQVKEQGRQEYEKMLILGKFERELQNIRKQLFPDNPRAGNLDYLRRKKK